MLRTISVLAATCAVILLAAGTAQADDIKCDKAAKKLQWHMCVKGPVEYKRGLKKETRTECVTNKKLKVKGCNLGNLMTHVPAGVELRNVVFYAIAPTSIDAKSYTVQQLADKKGCGVSKASMDPYMLMKFSDAYDKSNRDRSKMVQAKLAKKNKTVLNKHALFIRNTYGDYCKGKNAALGWADKKTQSTFLIYAETKMK